MQKLVIIYGRFKIVFCSSKFPWARERISSKFIDNLGKRNSKIFASPGLGSHVLCSRAKKILHVGHVSPACLGVQRI